MENNIYQNIKKNKKLVICILASFLFTISCHGFMMMNPSYSHDSLNDLIREHDIAQLSLGRLGQYFWCEIFGRTTSTWFIGLVFAFFVGMSGYLIASILGLQKKESLILLIGILITNCTISNSVATYMPWLDVYGGALFFTTAAAYFVKKYRFGFLLGIPFIILALSLYQPYVLCIPAIVFCDVVISYGRGEKIKKLGVEILRNTLMIGFSYVLYRVLLHIILKIMNVPMSGGYNSIAHVGINNIISEGGGLIQEISTAYEKFCYYLFLSFDYMPLSWLLKLICFITYVIEIIVFCKNCDSLSKRLLCVILSFVIFPVLLNIQFIISKKAYHILMIITIYFIWLYIIALHENGITKIEAKVPETFQTTSRKRLKIAYFFLTPMIVSLVFFANYRYANSIYTEKYLRERSTLSLMTRIMCRAEETEGYIADEMPIIIAGTLDGNTTIGRVDGFYPVEVGNAGRYISITYNINNYLKYYLGYTKTAEINDISDLETVKAMPVYPEDGFSKVIDNALVVKVSK